MSLEINLLLHPRCIYEFLHLLRQPFYVLLLGPSILDLLKSLKQSCYFCRLLDWVERDGKRSKFDRIVILKNMFDVLEFEVIQFLDVIMKVIF